MSIEPVVRDVWVPAGQAAAFRRFTDELMAWWPRATHSVSKAHCSAVTMEGGADGRIFETDDDGAQHEWGRIKAWEPPARFVVSWHPGRPAAEAQEVEVTFTPEGDGTRVRLTHRGWEAIPEEAQEARDSYAGGWQGVMATYAESLGAVR